MLNMLHLNQCLYCCIKYQTRNNKNFRRTNLFNYVNLDKELSTYSYAQEKTVVLQIWTKAWSVIIALRLKCKVILCAAFTNQVYIPRIGGWNCLLSY